MNLQKIVAEANLAPSVHNTQPTLWRADGDGLILSLDTARLLKIGDPTGRDARLSMGAALYGTQVAAARQGFGLNAIEHDGDQVRLAFGSDAKVVWDPIVVARRITWRQSFKSALRGDLSNVQRRDDTRLTRDPMLIDAVAILNDQTSLKIMRDAAFRDELRHWMRLSRTHPEWGTDGLNAEALGMSRVEAVAASFVLRKPMFEVLDKIGLGSAIVGEAAKTRTCHWIAAFHRPEGEDPLTSGQAFYEMWLALSERGQAAWPMAALADDPDAATEVCRLLGIPDGRQLINVLRVGPMPDHAPTKARRPTDDLIV